MMQIFDIEEAKHYCSSFSSLKGRSTGSLRDLRDALKDAGASSLVEGTTEFDEFRSCALRDADRSFFFSVSLYRRCLDSMLASGAPWAHVTLYYSGWLAAHSLLRMFGGLIDTWDIVEVSRGDPGKQSLRIRGIGKQESTYKGSHKRFWDLFYKAVVHLRPLVPPKCAAVLEPVSSDPAWLTNERNNVNYDAMNSLRVAKDFANAFSSAKFPSCLPGALGTQWRIVDGLMGVVLLFRRRFQLSTDALQMVGKDTKFNDLLDELVFTPRAPDLIRRTLRKELVRQ